MTAHSEVDFLPPVAPLESRQRCEAQTSPSPVHEQTNLANPANVPIYMRPNTAGACLGDLSITCTSAPTSERADTVPVDKNAQNGTKSKPDSFYTQAAGASQQEIQDMLKSGRINEHERELIEKIAGQGGRMYIEDRLRAFILGGNSNPADFQKELRGRSAVQVRDVAVDYLMKYGGSVREDFERRLEPNVRSQYAKMFDFDPVAAREQQRLRFWRLPSERF